MGKIKVTGLDKLQKKLKADVTLDDVKELVRKNGGQLQNKMQRNADFAKGYQTGTTKRSIKLSGTEYLDGGFTVEVGPGEAPLNKKTELPATEYSPYVEYGTRYMAAQPFVRPAFEEQKEKFIKGMQRLVK